MEYYATNRRNDRGVEPHRDALIREGYLQRFRAESLLGASLAGKKQYVEAEPLMLESIGACVYMKAPGLDAGSKQAQDSNRNVRETIVLVKPSRKERKARKFTAKLANLGRAFWRPL
jgi:hypothetical protein